MTNNMPPTIDISAWGETSTVHPRVVSYTNGRLALELWSEVEEDGFTYMEPYAKLTTNLPDQHLNEGEFFVKDWSENEPAVQALVEAGWLEDTGREVLSGYVAPRVMRAAGPLKEFLERD